MEWWRKFFDKDTERILFPEKRLKVTTKECDFIEEALNLPEHAKILDLACGIGRHSIELAKRGYNVTGLDYSTVFVNKAKKMAKDAKVNVRFFQGDMRKIPFKNKFDAVINMFTSFGYFHKDEDNMKVLKAVAKCLNRRGKFLLDTVNRDWLIRHFQAKDWYQCDDDILVLEERKLNLERSRIETKWIMIKESKRKEYFHSLRLFTHSELLELLNRAKLKVLASYGGFEKESVSFDSNRLIILSQKE
ncbi:MAG: class I SAM-dependent methyltransferase [Candidatus Thermoplasmatota archaeon]